MEQLLVLLAPYAAYVVVASVIASGLEYAIDEFVKPYVKSTPGDEDDVVVSKVEYVVDFASKALSFMSLRFGRK